MERGRGPRHRAGNLRRRHLAARRRPLLDSHHRRPRPGAHVRIARLRPRRGDAARAETADRRRRVLQAAPPVGPPIRRRATSPPRSSSHSPSESRGKTSMRCSTSGCSRPHDRRPSPQPRRRFARLPPDRSCRPTGAPERGVTARPAGDTRRAPDRPGRGLDCPRPRCGRDSDPAGESRAGAHEAAFVGEHDGLCAVAQVQLLKDARDMGLGRVLAHHELS